MDFFGSPLQLPRIMERSSEYILNVCKYPIPMIALHIRFLKKKEGGAFWNEIHQTFLKTLLILISSVSIANPLKDVYKIYG